MLGTSTNVAVTDPTQPLSLEAGATGMGEVSVGASCALWGGTRRIETAQPLPFRIARLRTVFGASGSSFTSSATTVGLSSGSAILLASPVLQARLEAEQAGGWQLPGAEGTTCTVEAGSLAPRMSQTGTKTRYFAQRGDSTGTVVLDALSLTGSGPYPDTDVVVGMTVTCEHPQAGASSAASLLVTVQGLQAEWVDPSIEARPAQVAVGQAWEGAAVKVSSRSTITRELAEAVRCSVSAANATRVDGGESVATAVGGAALVNFPALSVTGRRGASFELAVRCFVGQLPLKPVLLHRFSVLGCAPGQQPRPGSVDLCDACAADEFSDGGLGAQCKGCPGLGSRCVDGRISLLQGFYRPPGELGTPIGAETELHPCFNSVACTLNDTSREYGCADGYTGPLCGVCAPGWALFGKACDRCWEGDQNLVVVIGMGCLAAAAAVFLARRTAQSASARRSDRSIATRQLLSHLQGLGALTLFRSRGTGLFQTVAGVTQGVSASPMSWGPVQCALQLGFVGRFWATLALPGAAVGMTTVAFVVMELVAGCCAPSPGRQQRSQQTRAAAGGKPKRGAQADEGALTMRSNPIASPPGRPGSAPSGKRAAPGASAERDGECDELSDDPPAPRGLPAVARFCRDQQFLVALVIVLFLMYMSLVNLAVTALDCKDRPVAGVTYLEADLSVECHTGAHAAVVVGAVALLAAVGFGFPLGLVLALRKGQRRPSLRFVVDGYRSKFRWWEALVLVRKAGLTAVASLVTSAPSQVAAAMAVLVPAIVLQAHFRPYSDGRFNALETLSLSAMVATATVSLLYLEAQGGEAAVLEGSGEDLAGSLTGAAVTFILLGVNLGVMALLLWAACRAGTYPKSCKLLGCQPVKRISGPPIISSVNPALSSASTKRLTSAPVSTGRLAGAAPVLEAAMAKQGARKAHAPVSSAPERARRRDGQR